MTATLEAPVQAPTEDVELLHIVCSTCDPNTAMCGDTDPGPEVHEPIASMFPECKECSAVWKLHKTVLHEHRR